MENRYETEQRTGTDVKGRCHHGCYHTRAGKDRGSSRCLCGHALERIPADIRAAGGVSRMSDPKMIQGIQKRGFYPGYGKMPNRSFCGGSSSRSNRD